MRLGPRPGVGTAASLRPCVADQADMGVRARPRQVERGRDSIHARSRWIDADRSRAPQFPASRRRRRCHARWRFRRGWVGRTAGDFRDTRRKSGAVMTATRLFRIAAVLLVIFALGHTAGFLNFKPPTKEGFAVLNAMNSVRFQVGGTSFSY